MYEMVNCQDDLTLIITNEVWLSGDVLLIQGAQSVAGEDVLIEYDEVLDELVDEVLVDDLVPVGGYGD